MSPMQALVSATENGALAANMLNDVGTVEVGKCADLVLLEADPLEDIANIRKLGFVMTNGAIIDIEALPYVRVFVRE